jgi:hypothetical protein
MQSEEIERLKGELGKEMTERAITRLTPLPATVMGHFGLAG